MKPLYTQEEFEKSKSMGKLPCECYQCKKPFYKIKKEIKSFLNGTSLSTINFCSMKCKGISSKRTKKIKCYNCNNEFERNLYRIKQYSKNFCSHSCCASYTNKHKTNGNTRSKLELWIEQQLTILYPNLEILYNNKNTIGSELDIYIPSLNIAFELNGIFHYEPIFGIERLESAQRNDISKSKACFDNKIDLCVIDTTGQKYFKEATSKKYLDIIINIINQRTL